MSFYSRFEGLCREAGVKPQSKEMLQVTGVTSPAISSWNLKGSIPSADVLCRLADYFKVSVDYLMEREERRYPDESKEDTAETDQEKLLLHIFRNSDAVGQFTIIHTCMGLFEDQAHVENQADL